MKTLLATTAIAALISAQALAQEPAQPAPAPAEPPAATEPAPEEQAPMATEPAPAPDEEMGTEGTAQTETGDEATSELTFIDEQSEDQMLASNWIGMSVYGSGDEDLGDISDLVLAEDGNVSGVVIGVGGFLGIGEKRVAVPFDAIQVGADPESGDVTLHLAVARDQLEAAPDFMTLEDIQAAEEAAQQETMQPDSGLGTTPPAQ